MKQDIAFKVLKAGHNVFLGGSLVEHGGQNPLEAVRYGCSILHGPNVENFREIYKFLKVNNISQKVLNQKSLNKHLYYFFSKKTRTQKIQKKLNLLGVKF